MRMKRLRCYTYIEPCSYVQTLCSHSHKSKTLYGHTAYRLYCMDVKSGLSGLSVHLIIIKWMLSGTMPSGKFFNAENSVSCLLYYCKVLPMYYIMDQRKLLFLKKIRTCDNSIVRSLSILSTYEHGKRMSKYCIHNPTSGAAELKSSLWRHFVDTVF